MATFFTVGIILVTVSVLIFIIFLLRYAESGGEGSWPVDEGEERYKKDMKRLKGFVKRFVVALSSIPGKERRALWRFLWKN